MPSGTKAYEQTSEKEKPVINKHIFHNATKFAVSVNEDQERLPGCLRLGLSWINWWVSFAPEFQFCYFCESSCLFYLSFNFDFYVSKIMHL